MASRLPPRSAQEEALQTVRAALSTPHGTAIEKRRRQLAAWQELKSASAKAQESSTRRLKGQPETKRDKRSKRNGGEREGKRQRARRAGDEGRQVSDEEAARGHALLQAAKLGDHRQVALLLRPPPGSQDKPVKVTWRSEQGYSALHWAAVYGHLEVVRVLLGAGAGTTRRINRATLSGNTALHLACLGGHADVAALLHDTWRADAYVANESDQSPVSLGLRRLLEQVAAKERAAALQDERDRARQSQAAAEEWEFRQEVEGMQGGALSLDRRRTIAWQQWESYLEAWQAFVNKTKYAARRAFMQGDKEAESVPITDTSVGTKGGKVAPEGQAAEKARREARLTQQVLSGVGASDGHRTKTGGKGEGEKAAVGESKEASGKPAAGPQEGATFWNNVLSGGGLSGPDRSLPGCVGTPPLSLSGKGPSGLADRRDDGPASHKEGTNKETGGEEGGDFRAVDARASEEVSQEASGEGDEAEERAGVGGEERVGGVRVSFADIPWPVEGSVWRGEKNGKEEDQAPSITRLTQAGPEDLLLAALRLPPEDLRPLLRQERLRWHPDKFAQLFGRHVSPRSRDIGAGVDHVMHLLNHLANNG